MVRPATFDAGGTTTSDTPARIGFRTSTNARISRATVSPVARAKRRTCSALPMSAKVAPAGMIASTAGSSEMSRPTRIPSTNGASSIASASPIDFPTRVLVAGTVASNMSPLRP